MNNLINKISQIFNLSFGMVIIMLFIAIASSGCAPRKSIQFLTIKNIEEICKETNITNANQRGKK